MQMGQLPQARASQKSVLTLTLVELVCGAILPVAISCNGERTLAELAQQFDVHPNQITEWQRQLQELAPDEFGASKWHGVERAASRFEGARCEDRPAHPGERFFKWRVQQSGIPERKVMVAQHLSGNARIRPIDVVPTRTGM